MKRTAPGKATRRAKPKTKEKYTPARIFKYALLSLLAAAIITAAYNYRHGMLYWLGFKTNKRVESLTKEERHLENLRIYEILGRNKGKPIGIDVSHYQGRILWDSLKKPDTLLPVKFVFIRATAGKDGIDGEYSHNWAGSKSAGMLRGAYHYYRPDENSIAQADNFIKTVTLSKGDLPPVLDIEKIPNDQSLDSLKSGLKKWLAKVEKHYGMKPIIYSGESFYADHLKEEFEGYNLWIANYSFFKEEMQGGWQFWQFTDKAAIGGIEGAVDVNVYNGSLKGLRLICK